ncbi:sensor histidine kinase [Ferribacterium limneticum]|uniref:sensor histidine kinase n=1 Tax=Ferribacterium limneticum TaxID=76259 RepID=UPI001CF9D129|nr:sensor histidine kinase [Ferribacterium limneticum]UCV27394.1 sensor histidine kinase [Ferribacterium limneticum]UCV31311.1 sensor histidine kinase [Ferribacterium limneticum]
MDLRKRLVIWLGGLLAGLMLMAIVINLHSLRGDIQAEVAASEQLVAVLLKAGNALPGEQAELEAVLRDARLRHLSIRLDPAAPAADAAPHWLAGLLGIAPSATPAQTIRLGEQTLHIAPNPNSEIEERLGDTVRLCITLLLYSGATLLVAWWSADRALTPVRELEAGLQRLADNAPDAAMPPFALREFRRVAHAIDALAEALAASRAAQQQLARQLITVQEEERHTLARELHDDMGQTLTAIGVTAAFLERNAMRLEPPSIIDCARDLRRDVKTSGEQLRAMLKRLRPHGLDALGLTSALRELVTSWQQRESGIEFALDTPAQLPELDDSAALVLYRMVQEALTNVVRHSDALHCRIRVQVVLGMLQVSVEDDGKGLPEAGPARRGGLLGMEERLEMAGGNLTIEHKDGKGLRLHACLPLRRKKEQEEQ